MLKFWKSKLVIKSAFTEIRGNLQFTTQPF
jgi:hypothetical protein